MTKQANTEAAARIASPVMDHREAEMEPKTVKPSAKKT